MNSAMTEQRDDELVKLYVEAALGHGQGTDRGDSASANKAHDVVAAVYRELSRRGKQRLLLPLLHSAEPWVRSWAAAHGLEFAPEQAAPVLEVLSGKNGFVAFGAKMTLKQWRDGKLTFP